MRVQLTMSPLGWRRLQLVEDKDDDNDFDIGDIDSSLCLNEDDILIYSRDNVGHPMERLYQIP